MPFLSDYDLFKHFFKSIEKDFLIVFPIGYYNSETVRKSKLKTILFITEPIANCDHYKDIYKDYKNNYFDIIFGCINHDPVNNRFKFPLYLHNNNFHLNYRNLITNDLVKNMSYDDILSKKFCALINRWDPDNIRTDMYNCLIELEKITCPSKLLNNCSNEELNKIEKHNYLKQFKFNICSENFGNTLDGYITEKLNDSCLGCSIPIYCGNFDEIDGKIFNKNRILFYDYKDKESLNKVYLKVKYLLNNNDEFVRFYKQDIYNDPDEIGVCINNLKKDFFDGINLLLRN
tara:strand:+ start:5472 stop:6338 length:867 start_codon:yes stop_codon:yes gene_type:complete